MRGQNSIFAWTGPVGRRLLLPAIMLIALGACAMQQAVPAQAVSRPGVSGAEFRVQFDTDQGPLLLVFDPASAPQAVAALRQSFAAEDWNGVPILWVRPHTEIRTGLPRNALPLASELSAEPLGLGAIRIEDAGAAMNTIQFELEPAFARAGAAASTQLAAWIAEWRAHFDANFLVGMTRQQINEALGYRYAPGHATRPMRRGSVALVAAEPGSTSLALAILLRDQPRRDGCWVVVGRVESGLDLVDRLSIAPRLHPKSFEPAQPARISRTSITSAPSN